VAATATTIPSTTTTVPTSPALAVTGLALWPLLGASVVLMVSGFGCLWLARKRGRHARSF
jgi:hypothetical protein